MKQVNFNRWKENLSVIPCSITLCNALCGLSAIIYMAGLSASESPAPKAAIWLILAAMFFDLMDGYTARKLNAESLHGMQLDSLSDLVSFGIAPALLIYMVGQAHWEVASSGHWIAWSACSFYAACTIWRLACYNTIALSGAPSKAEFSGLPSPAAALAICSTALLINRIEPGPHLAALAIVASAFAMGFLMVSGFGYLHIKKLAGAGPAVLRVALLILMIGACLLFGEFAFFALVHLYVFSGPLSEIVLKNTSSAAAPLH